MIMRLTISPGMSSPLRMREQVSGGIGHYRYYFSAAKISPRVHLVLMNSGNDIG
jgi:hypothetical protein